MPKVHIPDWVKDIPPEVIEEEKRREEERRRREERDRPYAPPPEPPPDWDPAEGDEPPKENPDDKRGVEIIQL